MKPPLISIATSARCKLAENPVWHAESKCIYWTDISAGKIFRLDIASGEHAILYQGTPVGGFTLQQSGDLLLFRVNDIAVLSPDGKITSLRNFSDRGMVRFNDVIAAPDGSVFAGTIGQSRQTGGLYHMTPDGTIKKLFGGTSCSNGMGFSPDLKTFYWTCSTTRRIFQFTYNQSLGEISKRKVFYEAAERQGIPDGLAIDSEGCVWSACWGEHSVLRLSAEGEVLERISFPEANISSLCFGGENLDEIFVTAAQHKGKNAQPVPALFRASVRVRGVPRFRSKVGWNHMK